MDGGFAGSIGPDVYLIGAVLQICLKHFFCFSRIRLTVLNDGVAEPGVIAADPFDKGCQDLLHGPMFRSYGQLDDWNIVPIIERRIR